jgi:DNA-binding MarR family transcriptional regulator
VHLRNHIHPTQSHTLKPLERENLVAIAIDPDDRRSRRISVTREGLKKLGDTDVLCARAQQGLEKAVGSAQTKALRAALRASRLG